MRPKLHVVDASAEPAKAPRDWRRVVRFALGSAFLVAAAGISWWYLSAPNFGDRSAIPMLVLLGLVMLICKLGPVLIGERVHVHHHYHRDPEA